MGDRATEGAVLGALGIDVDPLVVAGDLGEAVDVLLRDQAPLADADLLAHSGLDLLYAGEREHGSLLSLQSLAMLFVRMRDAPGALASVADADAEPSCGHPSARRLGRALPGRRGG